MTTEGTDLWETLPERVFISHAYADGSRLTALMRTLPENVEAVTFSRLEPDPKRAVSDGIVAAIRSCGALIYLDGGLSEESLWVNFERDFACRTGVRVLAYDPDDRGLWEPAGGTTPLGIEVFVGASDVERARALLRWMKSERSFAFESEPTVVHRVKEIPILVCDLIASQRIAVWLMGTHVASVARMAREIPDETIADMLDDYGRTALPSAVDDYVRWLDDHSMYVRLTPDFHLIEPEDDDERDFVRSEYAIEYMVATAWAVDLTTAGGTEIDWNRADELIVRLTLMSQQSWPFFASDDD